MKKKDDKPHDLVSSLIKLNHLELKIFKVIVSKLDIKHLPKNETVYLTETELYSCFEETSKNKEICLKIILKDIMKKLFFNVKERESCIFMISEVSWNTNNNTIKVQFDYIALTYLIEFLEKLF